MRQKRTIFRKMRAEAAKKPVEAPPEASPEA
jgi:hypothetical protein